MARYGSDQFKIEVADSSSSLQDMSSYIDTINEFDIDAITEAGTAFGDSWAKELFTGVKKGNPITISGWYDDTAATGPDAVLNSIGDTRQVKLTWGGTKTSTFNAIITKYGRHPQKEKITQFTCTLTPTGAVTEA